MTAYLVAIQDQVADPAELQTYSEKAGAGLEGRPATPLAYHGAIETLEGAPAKGAVILQSPGVDTARDEYQSPAYQEARQHRFRGGHYHFCIIDGIATPA